ncbi:MAG TPA: AAA family ATPase, partial [Pseudoalteromonas shioyasakiensis]|nr:AAA family ATPase [Pseudoalteromonas shioyasakiensis]
MSTELDTNRMSLVEAADAVKQVKHNISRVLVGQDAIVEDVLTVLFAGGHVLLEGVP